MLRTLTIFSAVCLCAITAHATTITVLQGQALVSHGDGFESVEGVADLVPGDTVMAKAGSSAKVTFANGCTVFLGIGMVFRVPEQAPCEGATSADGTTTGAVPNTVSPSPTQDWAAVTQTTAASDPPQMNVMPYLLGAAVVGGGAAAALALSGGGGGAPASP